MEQIDWFGGCCLTTKTGNDRAKFSKLRRKSSIGELKSGEKVLEEEE